MISKAFAAALIGSTLIAAPLAAQTQPAESVAVKYSDLDLSTEKGQAKLDRRINAAAREVCKTDAVRTGTRMRSNDRTQCLETARASVRAQLAEVIGEERQAS